MCSEVLEGHPCGLDRRQKDLAFANEAFQVRDGYFGDDFHVFFVVTGHGRRVDFRIQAEVGHKAVETPFKLADTIRLICRQ